MPRKALPYRCLELSPLPSTLLSLTPPFTTKQAMVRRRATFEFDPVRGKVDRGTLVCLPELPTISWR